MKEKEKVFNLYYCPRDNGDGSSSVEFYEKEPDLNEDDYEQEENTCFLNLKIEKGKLYFQVREFNNGKTWEYIWKEIEKKK